MQVNHHDPSSRVIIAAGAEHTFIGYAVAAPTASGALSCLDSELGAVLRRAQGFGLAGSHHREACGMAYPMCSTPASPPHALEQAAGGFLVSIRSQTMSTSPKGKSARTIAPVPALPFVTHAVGPRGGHLATNFFDAPKTGAWSEGSQFGHQAAQALLAWAKGGCEPYVSLHAILQAAAAASDGTDAERGASYAFLDVVAQAIKFSAKHGNWDAHFERKAKEDAQWVAMEREREAQRIARSIATRKARQAAKQGGAA